MESHEAWQIIFNHLSKGKMDIPTTPINKRKPKWFSAEIDGDAIKVDRPIDYSDIKKDYSDLKKPKYLRFDKFKQLFSLYIRREAGETISKEATRATGAQVYYYGLIKQSLSNFKL